MSFPLIGNEKLQSAVINALAENRLAHALIIEGDVGMGRHTLAFFIAHSLICDNSGLACENCRNCEIAPEHHPDVTVISPEDGKKNISVAQIRSFKDDIYVKPHMSNRRVFIIDFADTMNDQAQNALLKILEEPPESAAFILIAESTASLLPTVISRCITLSLSVPSKQDAAVYLSENTDYDDAAINNALEEAHSNIGRALGILAGEYLSGAVADANSFLEHFSDNNSFGMLKTCAEYEKSRISAENFYKELKLAVFSRLKESPGGVRAVGFSKLCSLLCEMEELLVTNINLTLFFCTLVSRAEKINNWRTI